VLDGEVAIFDRQLRSRFDWLRDPDHEEVATPPLRMVFDLLYRAGRDQTKRPLRERRARLEEIVAGAERIFPVRRLTRRRRPCGHSTAQGHQQEAAAAHAGTLGRGGDGRCAQIALFRKHRWRHSCYTCSWVEFAGETGTTA
jgi:hypothetical protein